MPSGMATACQPPSDANAPLYLPFVEVFESFGSFRPDAYEAFHRRRLWHSSVSYTHLKIQDYHVTSLCAPPTIFRFLIHEDLTKYDLSSLEYCTIAVSYTHLISITMSPCPMPRLWK